MPGHADLEVVPDLGVRERRRRVALDEAEDDRAEERQREAAQAPEHRGPERGQDEEREVDGVERPHGRGVHDPGQRGEHRAEHPAGPRDGDGWRAGEGGQVGVVHDGPHGHAQAGPLQQVAQPDGHDHRHDEEHDVVERDLRSGDGDGVVAEDVLARPLLAVGLEDRLDDADEEDRQRDRDGQRGAGRGAAEAPHDPLEDQAHQGGDDQEHDRHRDGRGHAAVDVDPVVEEGGDHAHRAVREVEHAGRRVREHEPARGHREHAAAGEADQVTWRNDWKEPAPS